MSAPTRAELARAALGCEAIANAYRERARAYRAALQADAETELSQQGTAPTWRVPDLGSVSLPMGQDTAVVADENAYGAWVQRTYPTEARSVIAVTPAFTTALLSRLVPGEEDGELVDPATGEVVPGVKVRPASGPRPIRIVPADWVKDQFTETARAVVASAELPALPEGRP